MKRLVVVGAALAAAASFAFAQGPGYGYGPGYGPGGGYGPGMMGGGYGPGMMGGGPGAGGALAALNLTDEQREKIFAIQEEHRKKNWADKLVEQQKKVDGLRQQMSKSRVEAHNQIAAVLTPEQRKQLRQLAPGWFAEDE